MNNVEQRLISCFTLAFPGLKATDAPAATPERIADWDSIATLKLLSLVEEEFGVAVNFEEVDRLNSFSAMLEYVRSGSQ